MWVTASLIGEIEAGDYQWAAWREPNGDTSYTKKLLNTSGAGLEIVLPHNLPEEVAKNIGYMLVCTGDMA